MPPEVSRSTSRESHLLLPWIRRKFLVCGLQHFVAGVVFCALGLGAIAVTSVITPFVISLLLFLFLFLFSRMGMHAEFPLETSIGATFIFIIALSFWEAWRNPYGLGSFRRAAHPGNRASGTMLGSSGSIIGSLFLGGPRMVHRESTPFWNADNYCGQISTIRQQSYFGCSSGIAKLQPISYQELFPL